MKIGILGYGKEGKSAEQYFQQQNAEIKIFDNFTPDSLAEQDFSEFNLIMRSPSVPPLEKTTPSTAHTSAQNQTPAHTQSAQDATSPTHNWSSVTRYFFQHCPCPIIGVTGTKGKGTTSSIITALLKNLQRNVYLVGNIGNPALDVLAQLTPTDVIVYEMSSFQLWDLEKSPQIAVVLGIEPDHLNVHQDFQDYVDAKANIAKHQTASDTCIYYAPNSDSTYIAQQGSGQQIPYPVTNSAERQLLAQTLPHLAIPGQHNRDNAEAALLAVASFLKLPLADFIQQHRDIIIKTFESFQGLPHRLQFLRTLNQVKYYDDNFSTTPTSLEVAIKAFPEQKLVLIVGGRDKTDNQDLPEIAEFLRSPNLAHIICIGESGHELYQILQPEMPDRISIAENLPTAVALAQETAEKLTRHTAEKPTNNADNPQSRPDSELNTTTAPEVVVLMSPAAASFDMFENVYARGAEFQKLIQELH